MRKNRHDLQWIFWSGLFTVQSLGALIWLLSIQRDARNALIFGLSPSRLLLAAVITAILVIAFAAFLFALISPAYPQKFASFRENRRTRSRTANLYALLFFISGLAGWVFNFVLPEAFPAYIERLNPLLALLSLSSAELYCLIKPGSDVSDHKTRRKQLVKTALLFILPQIMLYALARISGLGLTPDPFDWQPVGMAVQYWQIGGAILIALLLGWVNSLLPRGNRHETRKTVLLFLLIWGAAAALWISVPSEEVLRNSYFAEITPPDSLPYPASDAAYFGLWSESVLSGMGLKNAVVSRQGFILILSAIQALSGNNLWAAVNLLTAFLALIPALLFLLGSQLHSRLAGMMIAVIAIFREYNTLYMAPHFGVSNAKMFLSDLPMMLFILIFVLAAVRWLRQPRSLLRMVIAAGTFVLAGLIRSQFLFLLPIILIFAAFQRVPRRSLVFFTLLVIVILSPALIRSIVLTGSPVIEDSGIHGYELARRYSDDVTWQPDPQTLAEQGSSAVILSFVRSHPAKIAHFISNHFTKELIDSWLVLPAGLPLSFTSSDITRPDYQDAVRRLAGKNAPELLFFALLTAVGLATAWRDHRKLGFFPLMISFSYLLTSAAGRYSGWRFILPVDWIFYFYFSIGTGKILHEACGSGIEDDLAEEGKASTMAKRRPSILPALGAALIFTLAAALPGLSRSLIPDNIRALDQSQMLEIVRSIPQQELSPELCNAIQGCTLNMVYGRLIFPRWFEAGDGLTSANPWPVYQIRDFDRLGFMLLNETNIEVILPVSALSEPLPYRAACLAVGRWSDESWFKADLLIFPEITGSDGTPLTIRADGPDSEIKP